MTISPESMVSMSSRNRTQLECLFDPQSIAVIGASENPAKRGYQTIRALQEAGYPHPVYPVNPRGGTVLGLPVVRSIRDLPASIDVALMAVPAAAVPAAIRRLTGIAACAVVLANGFRESNAVGAELEAELAAAVAESGIRVVGPNTSGILNAVSGANLVGVPEVPAGPVSVVTQSGNMLLSLLADNRIHHGPGFHTYVGLGNQVDLRYHECVTHLAAQPGTDAIAVHSEGMPDGRAFLVAAAAAVPHCPIVLLRGGRSADGKRAALSHTGSVAGSDEVATAVLTQAGVELVDRSDELAVVAGVLATIAPLTAGRGVVVLSDGGGHATLTVDALTAAGVELAELTERTRNRLTILLGERAVVTNPIDVAGATDTDPLLFAEAVEALAEDPSVGMVLIVGLYGGYHLRFDSRLQSAEDMAARALIGLVAQRGLPILVQSCYAPNEPDNHRVLRAGGIPVLASIDHAVRAVAALHRRGRRLATVDRRSDLRLPASESVSENVPPPPRRALARGDMSASSGISGNQASGRSGERSCPGVPQATPPSRPQARRDGGVESSRTLTERVSDNSDRLPLSMPAEPAARRMVEAAGIDTGPWKLVSSAAEAASAAAAFGGACALKVVSPQVAHKSDVGGVRLGVTADTAVQEWDSMMDSVLRHLPEADITGAVLSPMARPGVELLVGVTIDPTFGPVVAFGSGGILVEAVHDVTFRAAPFTHCEALEMIAETRAARMLDGYRHLPAVDRDALADFLVRVGRFAADTPELVELDLNPVVAAGSDIRAVDVRVVTRTAEEIR